MFAPRSSFLIAAVAVLALIAAEVDADKSARNARQLKGGKGSKSPKSPKTPKSMKTSKAPKYGAVWRRTVMPDMGDRRLTLQYMADRFKEEGSVRSFVESLGYEVDLNASMGEKENILAKEDCEGLMSLIDLDLDEDSSSALDIQKFINESDLASVIGKVSGSYHRLCLPSIQLFKISDLTLPIFLFYCKYFNQQDKFSALLDLHKEVVGATIPLQSIFIRHMRGNANSDAFIEYHTDEYSYEDGTYSTIIVALNDDSSVKEGGELYYLREDGPVLASRVQGKAFAHSYNVVHGVAPHIGDRVSLILHFNHDLKLEDAGGTSRNLTEETKRKLETRRFVL